MRLLTLPTPLASGAARVAQAVGRDPDVNPRAVEYMLRRGTYSNAKARELLGWEPRIALDDGMRRTLAWLRAEGLLG
jgi:nucleoside-diphosphate-sugar epimerase